MDLTAQASRKYEPATWIIEPALPPLPFELILNTMEIAARESTPTAWALAVVSKAVHGWIKPILYQTVALRTALKVEQFHGTATSPACNVVAHVRNLSLFEVPDNLDISLDILRQCTSVERLIPGTWTPWSSMDRDSFPEPWEAIITSSRIIWTAPSILLLGNVTHLYWNTPVPGICRILPQLTHFGSKCELRQARSDAAFLALTMHLLSENPTLKMVLLHSFASSYPIAEFIGGLWVELAKIEDSRLLARPGLRNEDFHKLLESGKTIWDNVWERFGNWRDAVRE